MEVFVPADSFRKQQQGWLVQAQCWAGDRGRSAGNCPTEAQRPALLGAVPSMPGGGVLPGDPHAESPSCVTGQEKWRHYAW